jgi:phage terminase small subunit
LNATQAAIRAGDTAAWANQNAIRGSRDPDWLVEAFK